MLYRIDGVFRSNALEWMHMVYPLSHQSVLLSIPLADTDRLRSFSSSAALKVSFAY